MQTTMIPVFDIHADGSVTPVPTCETCVYIEERFVGIAIPPKTVIQCHLTKKTVSLYMTGCACHTRDRLPCPSPQIDLTR